VDDLTATNLFIGHATGAFILAGFAWLAVSELRTRGLRALTRRRQRQRMAAARRPVESGENLPLSFR
jgi:hypothetical protein